MAEGPARTLVSQALVVGLDIAACLACHVAAVHGKCSHQNRWQKEQMYLQSMGDMTGHAAVSDPWDTGPERSMAAVSHACMCLNSLRWQY